MYIYARVFTRFSELPVISVPFSVICTVHSITQVHTLFFIHIFSCCISDTDEDQEDNVQFNALSEFYKSQGSGNLKEDFIKIKKENYNLVENKEGVYRDFALLQENYENIQDKLEKCVEFNDELVESRNLLQVQKLYYYFFKK